MNRRKFLAVAALFPSAVPLLKVFGKEQKASLEDFSADCTPENTTDMTGKPFKPLAVEYSVTYFKGGLLKLNNSTSIKPKMYLVNTNNHTCCIVLKKVAKNSFKVTGIGAERFFAKPKDTVLLLGVGFNNEPSEKIIITRGA